LISFQKACKLNPPSEPVIKVRGLKKSFAKIKALDGLKLTVFKGDIYGFVGPNGSGKSTTIRILTSLVKPDDGIVELFNLLMPAERKVILSRIGTLIERPDFYEHMSAIQNLKILNVYAGLNTPESDLLDLLKIVGLQQRANDRVKTFSEGMKQRIGIAQALINKPEVLILDEPFNSLDPQGVRDIRDLILKLNREKEMTIILSSHNLEELEKIVNRMVVINEGKAIAEGYINDLLEQHITVLRLEVDAITDAITIIQEKNYSYEVVSEDEGKLKLFCQRNEIPEILQMLVNNLIKIYDVKSDYSLENFFLSLTEK